jgi:hypothetical protein
MLLSYKTAKQQKSKTANSKRAKQQNKNIN